MAIQIDDIEPRRSYDVGGTPQAEFTIPFPFFDVADIRASVAGVELESGFTVTGAGSSSGGTLTLAAPVSNTVVMVWRDVAIKRISQFPASGPFKIDVLNTDLNKQVAVSQQLADRLGRSIRIPDAERTAATEIPSAAVRARKSLIFDDDGNVAVSSFDFEEQAQFPVQAAASAAAAAAAKADAESARDQAAVIRDQTSAVALGDFVQSGLGSVPRSVPNKLRDILSLRDFGAVGNGAADDYAALVAARDAAVASGRALHIPAGTYITSGQVTFPQAVTISGDGDGVSVIRRAATSTANHVFYVSGPTFSMRGVTLDGNKAANSTACTCLFTTSALTDLTLTGCGFVNGKMVGGAYGSGVGITGNETAGARYSVTHCRVEDNEGYGIFTEDADNLDVSHNFVKGNGRNGIHFSNFDLTFTKKIRQSIISKNRAIGNGGSGITVSYFIENNDPSHPIYGPANPETINISVDGNICYGNTAYGIAASGDCLSVTDNICSGNGLVYASAGGILFNARYSVLADNAVRGNGSYGVDAGGASFSSVTGNTITSNRFSSYGTGLNLGGCVATTVEANVLYDNGGDTNNEISVQNVDTDAAGIAFSALTADVLIRQNEIYLTGNRTGIGVYDGVAGIDIIGNFFRIPSNGNPAKALFLLATRANVKGNTVSSTTGGITLAVDGSGILYVPDILDAAVVSSSAQVNGIRYETMRTVTPQSVAWVTITDGGSGYTSAPTVSFSGGGGSGAAGTAFIDSSGAVKGVRMTSYGSGYTSAPTVAFSGGGGSGAAGTAQVGLPLASGRELSLSLAALSATAVKRNATPPVNAPSGADLVSSATGTGCLNLYSIYGEWRVRSLVGVS